MPSNNTELIRPFIGSWALVSWTAAAKDGTVDYPYGDDAEGRIMYLPEGKMVACLMRKHRTPFASNDRHAATPDEQEAAYREFMSYYGSFSVREAEGTVTHHVEGATFANWIGTDLVRRFRFTDNTLVLSLTRPDGTVHALTWKRQTA